MRKIETKTFTRLSALFLSVVLLSACQINSDTPQPTETVKVVVPTAKSFESIQKTVDRLKTEKKYQAAILEANKLLKQYPKNIEGYFVLADLYARQSMTGKLSALVDTMVAKFPDQKGVLLWQVRTAIQREKFQAALDLINPLFKGGAESAKKSEVEVLYYYGLLKVLQNDLEGGKKVMQSLKANTLVSKQMQKRALEIENVYDEFSEFSDGENAHFFALLAKNLIKHQEFVLAKQFAQNAAKEDADYIDAWILSGVAHYELEKYEAALVDLNLAYDKDPLRPETHFFLAETLQKLERYTEAALYYEKALDNGFEFNDSVTRQLIGIFTRQKKHDKIFKLYERLLEVRDAKSNEFVAAVGMVLNQQKNPEKALELAQKVYRKFPKDVVALNLLSWAQMENDLLKASQNTLSRAFKLEKNNARTFLNQGFLLEKQGEINDAVKWFQKSYQRAKETGESAITNLAADKYNELIQKVQSTASSDLARPTSAP